MIDDDQIRTKTNHFFLRNHDGHRIGVVALRLEREIPDDTWQVRVAVSLCHGNDAWNSTTGVAAARGRLDARNVKRLENMAFTVAMPQGLLLYEVFRMLKPYGIAKKNGITMKRAGQIDPLIDWAKMQALFERQWTYLTTPKAEATE